MESYILSHATLATQTLRRASIFSLIIAATLTAPIRADGLNPGDEAARHHLQFLSDTGAINIPLTTWPISNDDLAAALASITPANLDEQSYRSFNHLQSLVNNPATISLGLYPGTSRSGLNSFSTDSRENGQARASISQRNQHANGSLSLSVVNSPLDGKHVRLDGSQFSARLGNWNLGGGLVDRWWGPGWQSSLILSLNARPSPGIFLQRNRSTPFSVPVLKSLGPWQLTAFANQLESERFVPRAKLVGARFSFKPIPSLEIGLSRTAQWGGTGRPENLDTLFDLLIGNDNRGDSGIAADASNEPGNQLGGIDWRYSFSALEKPFAFYGQLIGEDEAGGLPTREIGMVGIETPFVTKYFHSRIFLEFSDTTMRFLDDGIANSAYEHSIYQSGYRYYGTPIGAASDNDSRTLTLGGYLGLDKGRSINWRLTSATINWDGVPAGNLLGPSRIKTETAHLEYQTPLTENSRLRLSGHLLSEPLGSGPRILESGVQSSIEFRF